MQRHAINLVTGVSSCCAAIWLWASCSTPVLLALSCTVLCTTIAFHGLHCAGRGAYADARVLQYDFAAAATSGSALIVLAPDDPVIFPVLALVLGAWLLSFHRAYRRVPLNPLASVIHGVALWLNLRAAARPSLCGAT